jgi:3-methyladenine DNA glycosylase AlkD
MDVTKARRELVGQVRHAHPPPSSFDLQSYVGSPYPVLGLSAPQLRGILRGFVAEHRDPAPRDLNRLAGSLWRGPTYEEKILAILLMDRFAARLDDASWSLLDRWVETAIGWGLSDSLAAGPIASMVYRSPARFREVMRWTRARHFWRRRASTYALARLVQSRELDPPFRLLERLLYDDEFWVQRAVGTWLRECWKRDRRRTEAFLRAHVRGLPPVVITVATERAPKAFRAELRRRRNAPERRAGASRPRGR